MSYFTILALGYGLVMLLTRPMIHLFPQAWADIEMGKIYTDRQPVWVWLVGCFGVGLVAFTWYMHFTAGVAYSIVITLLFSLTAIKGLKLLLDYPAFQQWVTGLLRREGGRRIVWIDLGVSLIGLIMIVVSLWLY